MMKNINLKFYFVFSQTKKKVEELKLVGRENKNEEKEEEYKFIY